jgi:methyl-accepting chemotaxis protein
MASKEQSEGIGQITRAVGEMDRVTQANAATAEETSSAATELNTQTERLRAVIADLTAMVKGAGGQAEDTEQQQTSAEPEAHEAEASKPQSKQAAEPRERATASAPRAKATASARATASASSTGQSSSRKESKADTADNFWK